MADSQLILELLFLPMRDGCSLIMLLFFPDTRGDMLFYSVCQSLRSASYAPSFTSARKFINKNTLLSGRNAIVFSRWLHNSSAVKHTGLHSIETRCTGFIDLILKL